MFSPTNQRMGLKSPNWQDFTGENNGFTETTKGKLIRFDTFQLNVGINSPPPGQLGQSEGIYQNAESYDKNKTKSLTEAFACPLFLNEIGKKQRPQLSDMKDDEALPSLNQRRIGISGANMFSQI